MVAVKKPPSSTSQRGPARMEPEGEMMQEPPRQTKSLSGGFSWVMEVGGWVLEGFEEGRARMWGLGVSF